MNPDPQTTPLLLNYRHPTTDPPAKIDWSSPRYPLIGAGIMTLIGFLSAGHSLGNVVAALSLPFIASWYVAVRTWRDAQVAPLWRALLLVLGVCCVLLAAWAQTVDYGMPQYVEHWQIYGHVREELYPLAVAVAVFALLRGVLWVYGHKRPARAR